MEKSVYKLDFSNCHQMQLKGQNQILQSPKSDSPVLLSSAVVQKLLKTVSDIFLHYHEHTL